MIIHGRQQILPPNMIIGRTQIQGACIGIERIVGLWLGWQAVQAIVNAFGADGAAVIKATNAYLNGIAATDQSKAQALAALINEDPMMVCSLGLEPQLTVLPKMPGRYLCGNGQPYIDSGFSGFVWSEDTIEAVCRAKAYPSTIAPLLGCRNPSNDNLIFWATPQNDSTRHGNYYTSTGVNGDYISNIQCIIPTKWKFSKRKIYYNDELQANVDNNRVGTNSILIFKSRDSTGGVESRVPQGMFMSVKIWDNDVPAREMYPFIRNGVYGMIDVIHDNLYTNIGSGAFTIEYGYWYNGSWVTWTPQTP